MAAAVAVISHIYLRNKPPPSSLLHGQAQSCWRKNLSPLVRRHLTLHRSPLHALKSQNAMIHVPVFVDGNWTEAASGKRFLFELLAQSSAFFANRILRVRRTAGL